MTFLQKLSTRTHKVHNPVLKAGSVSANPNTHNLFEMTLLSLLCHSDFDKCQDDSEARCTQFCHNFVGGYYCSCRLGYHLKEDNHTCTGKKTPRLPPTKIQREKLVNAHTSETGSENWGKWRKQKLVWGRERDDGFNK